MLSTGQRIFYTKPGCWKTAPTSSSPKQATAPDVRERIGASLRGPTTARLAQKIGLRSRRWWWDGMGWSSVQPKQDQWNWPDKALAELESRGMALDYVSYAVPDWAKGRDNLFKDMS